MSTTNYAIAVVFGILFGYLIGGFGQDDIRSEDAGALALRHLNNQYDPGAFAINIENVTRESDYYVVQASVAKLLPQDTEQLIVSNTGEVVEVVEVPSVDSGVGSGGAIIKIVEYADFQCPYCARALPAVREIKETYGDQVEFEFKHFPLTSIHPYAQKAAEASECARDQGKFWEYHDVLFDNYNALMEENLIRFASELGLDMETFSSCLSSGEKARLVRQHMTEGQREGVRGTPAFFVGDELITGAQPFSVFQQAIDAKLAAGP